MMNKRNGIMKMVGGVKIPDIQRSIKFSAKPLVSEFTIAEIGAARVVEQGKNVHITSLEIQKCIRTINDVNATNAEIILAQATLSKHKIISTKTLQELKIKPKDQTVIN